MTIHELHTLTNMLAGYSAREVAGWLEGKGRFSAARLFAEPTNRVAQMWESNPEVRPIIIDLMLSMDTR